MSDQEDVDTFDADDAVDEGNRTEAGTAIAVTEYLVRELVDDPDAVTVDPVTGRRGFTLEVAVGPGDMGRVIGRRGRMANAIRTVVRAAAAKDGTEVDVDFVD